MNELVEIPKSNALAVFTEPAGLDPYLARIRQEIDALEPDISTPKGRAEIASLAFKVSRCKTALDGVGKELVAELKEVPKKVDAERKRMRDTLDAWRDEVRLPLTEYEEAERYRVAQHEADVKEIEDLGFIPPDARVSSAHLNRRLAELEAIDIGPAWQEFEARAARAKEAASNALRVRLAEVLEAEQEAAARRKAAEEAAEAERLEREARIAREAEARAAAAAAAEQERAEREHAAALAAAQKEFDEELERQERARLEEEAERLRLAAEAERLAANKNHRAKINRAARYALVDVGLSAGDATAVVRAIAAGRVPAVSICYASTGESK